MIVYHEEPRVSNVNRVTMYESLDSRPHQPLHRTKRCVEWCYLYMMDGVLISEKTYLPTL